jgi:hypothetical protein
MSAACASILSACSGAPQQSANDGFKKNNDGFKKNIASIFDPQLAAQQNYDHALAEYQNCFAANPKNRDACEQQSQAMEAAVKVLAATLNTGR